MLKFATILWKWSSSSSSIAFICYARNLNKNILKNVCALTSALWKQFRTLVLSAERSRSSHAILIISNWSFLMAFNVSPVVSKRNCFSVLPDGISKPGTCSKKTQNVFKNRPEEEGVLIQLWRIASVAGQLAQWHLTSSMVPLIQLELWRPYSHISPHSPRSVWNTFAVCFPHRTNPFFSFSSWLSI